MEEDFDFGKKVSINDSMDAAEQNASNSTKILLLLRGFLGIQQRRAEAYSKLKRVEQSTERGINPKLWGRLVECLIAEGFSDYMASGGELAYQKLCSEITIEFNDCSKKVLEMESLFQSPDYQRLDLAQILRAVQDQEKQKLHLVCVFG
ncbi:hypothetical protein Ahy_A10g047073 isoform B [Arachis hypogaea]|uniref:Uncharacterized protein n=1 Tax=Arachis hypogaea TaxID=3818 RepID=A0A445B1K6_ARAHY|nr:hypothetical protein Ahy_A10g047073 isoform B [Arachis hypogaea]